MAQRIRRSTHVEVRFLSAGPKSLAAEDAAADVRVRHRRDDTGKAKPAIKTAERAPHAELCRNPYGHFDIYHDPQVKADQVAFLQRAVQGVAA